MKHAKLEKKGWTIHKDGLPSQAQANLIAKEVQEIGYNTKVVEIDGFFAVYVKEKKGNQTPQGPGEKQLPTWSEDGFTANREKQQFAKVNGIVSESRKTKDLDKAIATWLKAK